MTGKHVRPGPQGPAAAPTICYMRVPSPVGPLYLAFTEGGVLFVSSTAAGDEAFLSELRARYGRRLEGVRLARADASARARWREAVRAWVEQGQVPPLDLRWVTPFERRVLETVRAIPRGQVRTYQEVARAAGCPGAARAVGQVMARNPVPLFVPCHRVVRADGTLGEYSGGGPGVKARLLAMEGYPVSRRNSSTSARAKSSASCQKSGRARSTPR